VVVRAVPVPDLRSGEAVWEATDRYLAEACDQRAGRIEDHMSTAGVARDLDLLRQAVGDETLNSVGYSLRLVPRRHLREPVLHGSGRS